MLDSHAYPLEPKKHETKNLVKPGHGMPVRTHDSRTRAHANSSQARRGRYPDAAAIL